MWSKRSIIDYSLQKRATIFNFLKYAFHGTTSDPTDADPYLFKAAKFHGEETERDCPLCRREKLVELNYIFGDELGQYSGRLKSSKELEELENEHGEFRVYVVEICQRCRWNHLHTSYLLGDGRTRKPPRRVRTLEDEDFAR